MPRKQIKIPVYERDEIHIKSTVIKAGVKIYPCFRESGLAFIRVEYDNGDFQDGKKLFNTEFKKINSKKKPVHDPSMWIELKRIYSLVYNQLSIEKFKKQ